MYNPSRYVPNRTHWLVSAQSITCRVEGSLCATKLHAVLEAVSHRKRDFGVFALSAQLGEVISLKVKVNRSAALSSRPLWEGSAWLTLTCLRERPGEERSLGKKVKLGFNFQLNFPVSYQPIWGHDR